jgi:hypothetical protein
MRRIRLARLAGATMIAGGCSSFANEAPPLRVGDEVAPDGGLADAPQLRDDAGPTVDAGNPRDGSSLRFDFEDGYCTGLQPRTAQVSPLNPGFLGSKYACRLCYSGDAAAAFAVIEFPAQGPGTYRLAMRARAADAATSMWIAELILDDLEGGTVKESADLGPGWNDVSTSLRYPGSSAEPGVVRFHVKPGTCYAIDEVVLTVAP